MSRFVTPAFAIFSLSWALLSFALFIGGTFGDCLPGTVACATKGLASGLIFWRWLAVQLAGAIAFLVLTRRLP